MLLSIATLVVLVLLAVAILPAKKRQNETKHPTTSGNNVLPTLARSINLREQQLQEEAEAIAAEYRRRADEVWLAEVSAKATSLLKAPTKTTTRKLS